MGKIRMIKQTPGEKLGLEAQRLLSFQDIPERSFHIFLCLNIVAKQCWFSLQWLYEKEF